MRSITVILAVLLTFTSFSIAAKNYYRYKDKSGKIVIKDYLPQQAIISGYQVLNDGGRVIQTIPAELSKEQKIIEQKRQEQLKVLAEKRKKERQKDALLLRQYNTLDDIARTEKSQTGTLNINIRIVKNHSRSLRRKLINLEKRAADFERRGKAIPSSILSNIDEVNNQLVSNEKSLLQYQNRISEIKSEFNQDRERFQQLKVEQYIQNSMKDPNARVANSIYECDNVKSCEKSWSLAQIFAHENSKKRLNIVTNTLIITERPQLSNEIGFSITKTPSVNDTQRIVFDVKCYDSEKGQQLCQSQEVSVLRQKFMDYVAQQ